MKEFGTVRVSADSAIEILNQIIFDHLWSPVESQGIPDVQDQKPVVCKVLFRRKMKSKSTKYDVSHHTKAVLSAKLESAAFGATGKCLRDVIGKTEILAKQLDQCKITTRSSTTSERTEQNEMENAKSNLTGGGLTGGGDSFDSDSSGDSFDSSNSNSHIVIDGDAFNSSGDSIDEEDTDGCKCDKEDEDSCKANIPKTQEPDATGVEVFDLEPRPYARNRTTKLTSVKAREILDKAEKSHYTPRAPYDPQNGDIYVYGPETAEERVADCHRWRNNTGWNKMPKPAKFHVWGRSQNVLTEDKPIDGDSKFIKYTFTLPVANSERARTKCLVQYIGDPSISKPFRHGNSNSNTGSNYIRSAPSIGRRAKADLVKPPQEIYKDLLSDPKADGHPGYQPRNRKQVENFQTTARANNRISHDALYNTYVIGFEFPEFVKRYQANFETQNNLVYLTSRPLLKELNDLLEPPALLANPPMVQVLYDTKFQLGPYYVSVFAFRHYKLRSEHGIMPVVPAAFLIHQRKLKGDHHEFLKMLSAKTLCPNLKMVPFAFISDREFKNISTIYPKARQLYCWNHLETNVRNWTSKPKHRNAHYQRKGTGSYVQDINALLRQKSEQKFNEKVSELSADWAPGFVQYFTKKLKADYVSKACRWVVEQTGLYDNWSGITSNAAESINSVIGRAFGKPKAMDEAVLHLFFLTNYYAFEISQGLCNNGTLSAKYKLDERFLAYKRNILDVSNKSLIPPAVLQRQVKEKLAQSAAADGRDVPQATKDDKDESGTSAVLDDSSEETLTALQRRQKDEDVLFMKRALTVKPNRLVGRSQMRVAKLLSQTGMVTLVSQRNAFLVDCGEGKKVAVTLFPKESCQCGATATCYHILAARISIGMPDVISRGRKNTTRLFQNYRPKVDRLKTMNKPPRPFDFGHKKERQTKRAADSMLGKSPDAKRQARSKPATTLSDDQQPEYGVYGDLKEPRLETPLDTRKPLFETLTTGLREATSTTNEKRAETSDDTDENQQPNDEGEDGRQNLQASTGLGNNGGRFNDLNGAQRGAHGKDSDSLFCLCQQPCDGRPMIECDGSPCQCAQWYHQDCAKPPVPKEALRQKKWTWVSQFCMPPMPHWGGEIHGSTLGNTCTIDNALSIMYMFALQHPEFLEKVSSRILKNVLDLFMTRRFVEGKVMWARSIAKKVPGVTKDGRNIFNLFGSEHDMFFAHLEEHWCAQSIIQCTGTCSTPQRPHNHSNLSISTRGQGAVQALFDDGMDSKSKCTGKNAQGQKCNRTGKFINFKFDEKCFGYPIKLANKSIAHSDLDEVVVVGNNRYRLAGMTMHDPSGQGHFSAYILWSGNWLFYDGTRTPELSENLPESHGIFTPGHALYLRL